MDWSGTSRDPRKLSSHYLLQILVTLVNTLQGIHLGCVFLLDMSLRPPYSFQTCSGTEGDFLPVMLPDMFAIPIIAINSVFRVKLPYPRWLD